MDRSNSAQDQAIINIDTTPNIRKQIPEKAYLFGFIDGANWKETQLSEEAKALREALHKIADNPHIAGYEAVEIAQKSLNL